MLRWSNAPASEDLPIIHLNCVDVKENKIWVAMSVVTLVTNEGKMLGCIQEKILVSYMLIWDHDQPVAGSPVLLQ
jgi:UbiD family decarboxylase